MSAASPVIQPQAQGANLEQRVKRAFVDACLLDVTALKPGNVGIHNHGHGMEAADFVKSARAAAPAIAAAAQSVGSRIYGAISATRAAVGTNTNLGIVLLAAPLAQAVHEMEAPGSSEALHDALAQVLATLSVADAQLAFDAIQLASPGGLGAAHRHDVRAPARVSLLEAMREAADRDSIARQYVTAYADVVEIGWARLQEARARGCDRRCAATEVFLGFLASFPDSHVARKFGAAQAQSLRQSAAEQVAAGGEISARRAALRDWDVALKARRLNPGTSADLTVAVLFWDGLLERERESKTRSSRQDGLIL
jgi:triphosphoribosyl-dephospho-CoA synthase